jgi:hypothetical protein
MLLMTDAVVMCTVCHPRSELVVSKRKAKLGLCHSLAVVLNVSPQTRLEVAELDMRALVRNLPSHLPTHAPPSSELGGGVK